MSVANGNKKRELEKNDATDASAEPIAKKKCCWNYRITVEPLGFLYLTAGIVQSIVTPNLYLYKVCAVNFNVNATLCDPRGNYSRRNTELADRVQSYVSTLHIYGTLIDNIPSFFLMLFLLPWSDKHGRKPLMMAPLVGHVLSTLSDITNYYLTDLPAEYLLFATVPVGLTGGRGIAFMAMNRYLIDITNNDARTWRLSLLGGMIGISVPFANLMSGYIYASGGNIAIWGTALCLYAVAFVYLIFGFSDSCGPQSVKKITTVLEKSYEKEDKRKNGFDIAKENCMFIFTNLYQCFVDTFKRREGYKRACISLLIAMTCLMHFSNANGSVGYFYARKKFGWDAPDWAFYVTLVSACSVAGTLIVVPILSGLFKVNDGIIGVVALLANIGSSLTMAFAVSSLMVRLSSIGHIVSVGGGIVIHSIFSKILAKEELSRVFSVLASIQSLMPLITGPIINLVYQATIRTFPGCIFLVRGCITMIVFVLFVVLQILQWKDLRISQVQPFLPINEESDTIIID